MGRQDLRSGKVKEEGEASCRVITYHSVEFSQHTSESVEMQVIEIFSKLMFNKQGKTIEGSIYTLMNPFPPIRSRKCM